MNRNRRSMGTVKTDWKAQRTSSTGFTGPPSTNKKSKLPKPASSSASRGRSGSMDRPRGSVAAATLGEFKTPRSKSAMTRTPLSNIHQNSVARTSLHPSSAMRSSMHKRGRSPGKRSSVYGSGVPIKDNRPIGDKKWRIEVVDDLVKFGALYDQTFTHKDLNQMSTTTFRALFEFLYQFLNPSFTLPNSKTQPIHEVVPDLLKKLNYPGTVSKSHFQTLGGPSFGNVLGVFHFLLTLAKMVDCVDSKINLHCFPNRDEQGFQCNDKPSKQELEYQYLTGAYKQYCSGRDDFPELLEEFEFEYLAQLGVTEELLYDLESRVRNLEKENKDLKEESGDLGELEEQYAKVESDIKGLQDYITKYKESHQRKSNALKDALERIRQTEQNIQTLEMQIKELESECIAKGIDYKDTSSHNEEIIFALQARVEARKADLEDVDKERWEIEQKMSNIAAAIDGHKRNFSKMLIKLDDAAIAKKFRHCEVDHLPTMIHDMLVQEKENFRILQKNAEELKQKMKLCKIETAKKEKFEVTLSKEKMELTMKKDKLEQEIKIQDETLTRKVKEAKEKLASYSNTQNKLGTSLKSKEEQLATLLQQKVEAEERLEKFIKDSHAFLKDKMERLKKKREEQLNQREQAIKEYEDYEKKTFKAIDKVKAKIADKLKEMEEQ